jgi:hypothetical protein
MLSSKFKGFFPDSNISRRLYIGESSGEKLYVVYIPFGFNCQFGTDYIGLTVNCIRTEIDGFLVADHIDRIDDDADPPVKSCGYIIEKKDNGVYIIDNTGHTIFEECDKELLDTIKDEDIPLYVEFE